MKRRELQQVLTMLSDRPTYAEVNAALVSVLGAERAAKAKTKAFRSFKAWKKYSEKKAK